MKSYNLSMLLWATAIILLALSSPSFGQSETRCLLPNGEVPDFQTCKWVEMFRVKLPDPGAERQIRTFVDEQLSNRSEVGVDYHSCVLRFDTANSEAFASVVCLAASRSLDADSLNWVAGAYYRDASFTVPLTLYSQNARAAAGMPAPLNKDETASFRKSVAAINRHIRKAKCQGFLTVYFGRDIIETISRKLDEHQAFSGPRSTGINVIDAGLYADLDLARFRKLAKSWDTPVAQAATYEMGRTVGQLFADDYRSNGRSISAAVGKYNGNPNTAFYRKVSALIVLHEILHIVTGLADNDLAKKLGIDISQFYGDYELASAEITEALKRHGCS